MKKSIERGIILVLSLVIVVTVVSYILLKPTNPQHRYGLNLDCARNFYTPNQLKSEINMIRQSHGNYIQLHLTDNENFGVENSYLGQTTVNANQKNGVFYNKTNHHPFLSKQQLKSVIDYGESKHVQVVPEIDLPGHSQAMLELLKKQHPALEHEVQHSPQEMYYQNPVALQISKSILKEYFSMMPKNSYMATGGDEIMIQTASDRNAIVKYENSLDTFLNHHHLGMIVWNDCIQKAVLKKYYKNIIVNFWSLTGNLANSKSAAINAQNRATLPEMNKVGIQTINCNSYYTYLVMDKTMDNNREQQFLGNLGHFKLGYWNGNTGDESSNMNNIGTGVSVWGDPTNVFPSDKIISITKPLVSNFLNQVTKK